MSLRRKLDKVSEALSPREAVIAWHREVEEFGSLLTYTLWLRRQPQDAWPLPRLTRRVVTAAEKQARGRRPHEVARAREQARRSAFFLLALTVTVNIEVARRQEQLHQEVRGLLCGSRLATYEALARTERLREEVLLGAARPTRDRTNDPASPAGTEPRLCAEIRAAHLHLLVLDQSVTILSTRYLKGEDLLFLDLRSRLELLIQTTDELAASGERLRAMYPQTEADLRKELLSEALGRRSRRAPGNPESASLAPDRAMVTEAAARSAENLLLLAKAETYALLGKASTGRPLRGQYLERRLGGDGAEEAHDPSPGRTSRSPSREPRTRSRRKEERRPT